HDLRRPRRFLPRTNHRDYVAVPVGRHLIGKPPGPLAHHVLDRPLIARRTRRFEKIAEKGEGLVVHCDIIRPRPGAQETHLTDYYWPSDSIKSNRSPGSGCRHASTARPQ